MGQSGHTSRKIPAILSRFAYFPLEQLIVQLIACVQLAWRKPEKKNKDSLSFFEFALISLFVYLNKSIHAVSLLFN